MPNITDLNFNEVNNALTDSNSLFAATSVAQLATNRRTLNTITLLGDSITAQHVINDSVSGARGYFTWANTRLNKVFSTPIVESVGSEGAGDILTRASAVTSAATKTQWCAVLGGLYDIIQGRESADIIADLQATFELLVQADIRPIACTLFGFNGFSIGASEYVKAGEINAWIKDYARANSLPLADFNAYTADVNGQYKSADLATDNVLPSQYGASLAGEAFYMGLVEHVAINNAALITTNSEPNAIANGMFDGGSTLATGWALFGDGAVASKVLRDDNIIGEFQKITSTGESDLLLENANTEADVRWSEGDEIYAEIYFETDSDFVGLGNLVLEMLIIKDSPNISTTDNFVEGAFKGVFLKPEKGVLRTKSVVIPTGENVSGVRLRIAAEFSGGIRFSNAAIKKVV